MQVFVSSLDSDFFSFGDFELVVLWVVECGNGGFLMFDNSEVFLVV